MNATSRPAKRPATNINNGAQSVAAGAADDCSRVALVRLRGRVARRYGRLLVDPRQEVAA